MPHINPPDEIVECPFCTGYKDAVAGDVNDPTMREVETAHPEYTEADCRNYIQGALDGYDMDAFRMFIHTNPLGHCPLRA